MASILANRVQDVLALVGEVRPIPVYSSAAIHTNPLDIFVSYLAEYLTNATGCDRQVAYDSIEWSNDFGDLVAVLPRLRLSTDTTQLSADLAANFPSSPLFAQPFADEFNLRFMFPEQVLARVLLTYILDRGALYGKEPSQQSVDPDAGTDKPRTIVVEYSSPNLGRDFDGNHLRSTIVGAFLSALHAGMGWRVCRVNFLGDWGKHIGLLAVGWSRYGSEEKLEADPLRHLLDVFTRINGDWKVEQEALKSSDAVNDNDAASDGRPDIGSSKDTFFKKMEDGDPEALELWQRFRDTCVTQYQGLYAQMNVDFDDYSGESGVSREAITEVEDALRARGFYDESEQAYIIDFTKHGHPGLGTAIARFSNGTTSYLLRDIAAVLDRKKKYDFDKMLYIVSGKQTSHFKQILKALEFMDRKDLADTLEHVGVGGEKGLSPHPGAPGLLAADILEHCQVLVKATQDDRSPTTDLAIAGTGSCHPGWAALMVHNLSIKRATTVSYNPSQLANAMDHNFLQLQSALQRTQCALEQQIVDPSLLVDAESNLAIFEREVFVDILRHMIQFPGVVRAAYNSLESSNLVGYLYRLSDLLPAAMEEQVETNGQQGKLRVLLLEAARHVLVNGLDLLGLPYATSR